MNSARRTVPVVLPDYVWGRLASIAEFRGVKVADVIADALWETLRHPRRDVQERALGPSGDNLRMLSAELNAARAAGWRAPRRERTARDA